MRPILCVLGVCGAIAIAPAQAWAVPSAQDVSGSALQGTSAGLTLRGGSNLDSPVSFSIVSGPSHGSLGPIGSPSCSINPGVTDCTAAVIYTPDPGYSGSDAFTYRVGDADGTVDATASIAVLPAPPPGFTDTGFTGADPGTSASLTLPGITGTLTNPGSAPRTAYFVLATYPPSAANTVYDVRAISVSSGAQLTVTFRYAGDIAPTLLFLNSLTGTLEPVRSATYLVDPDAHTVTVVFDQGSTPTLTGLTGTRFEVGPLPRIERLRVQPSCAASSAHPPSLRLSLSASARVDLSVARRKGSGDRASCGRHRHAGRHAAARFERPRRLSRELQAGKSRIRLPRLAPGAYRVKVTATNSNGSSSATTNLLVTR